MKFAVSIFPTDRSISMRELAVAAEERGYESLWVAEHTHIPTSRESAWPGGPELPEHYRRTLDPFIALTEAAVATTRLRLGTGVCLLIQHDPIVAAKVAASLDHVSGGRLLFGVGGGWNREEMADHGTDFRLRWKVLRERVEAVKAIWTQDAAEYHGETVDFGPMWSWPKPVQRPHPPVLLGGNGPNTLQRVVRYADGWMPNRGEIEPRIAELQALAADAGRAPIPVTTYPRRELADIERWRAAGVERAIFWLPQDGRDAALRGLEELTALLRPLMDAG